MAASVEDSRVGTINERTKCPSHFSPRGARSRRVTGRLLGRAHGARRHLTGHHTKKDDVIGVGEG
jgi:hypothetical protein